MVGVFRDTLGQCQIAPYSKMIPTAITGLNANSTVAGQITLSWSGGLGSNVIYSYVLSTGTIQSVSGSASPVTITLTSTAQITTTVTLTARVLGGSTSVVSNSVTTINPYKTPSVTSGLVLHSDFLNPTTYSGTGTTFYNLVDSAAQSILSNGTGSYSYSSGYLVLSNNVVTNTGTYIQLANYTFQTISIWFKPTLTASLAYYLLDERNLLTNSYLYYNPDGSFAVGSGLSTIFMNGGAANAYTNLVAGVLVNITAVLSTAVTGIPLLFCRYSLQQAFDGSISRIVMYNRALSQSENTQIYNDLK